MDVLSGNGDDPIDNRGPWDMTFYVNHGRAVVFHVLHDYKIGEQVLIHKAFPPV